MSKFLFKNSDAGKEFSIFVVESYKKRNIC